METPYDQERSAIMITEHNKAENIAMTRDEAERLLIEEARLVDDGEFDQWLALFTDDCLYWLPTIDGDPNVEPSLIYDDRTRLAERVFRITETRAHAQDPLSRTLHNVTNVAVTNVESGTAQVRCNLMVVELRPGDAFQLGIGQQRILAGRVEYLFVHEAASEPKWRIKQKKVSLIDRDQPLYNLTFIV
jgi:benzoate/toluate 1,2-dioxygenase beta subunit